MKNMLKVLHLYLDDIRMQVIRHQCNVIRTASTI